MRNKHHLGFTLIELVVTITILAILGTLGFVSFQGYSKDARNSTRISDMKLVVKALALYNQTEAFYPLPTNATNIVYSGAIAWVQGTFGEDVRTRVGRISNVPIDPLFGVEYTYSTLANGGHYQIAGAMEGGAIAQMNLITPQANALANGEFKTYLMGDFLGNDVLARTGTGCFVLAVPSIILSDIPNGGIISQNSFYNYSSLNGAHLPSTLSGFIDYTSTPNGFQTVQVFNNCSMNTLNELELYIAQLSTAFQSLSSIEKYEDLIYNSNTPIFKQTAVDNLQALGVEISPALLDTLKNPPPEKTFIDTFIDTDSTRLMGGHTASPGPGTWSFLFGGNSSAYTIIGNSLTKVGASTTLIYPLLTPGIGLPDYSVSFTAQDFAGGYIETYLRYTDTDNYYKARISPSGYEVMRRLAGVDSIFQNISEAIPPGSSFSFSVAGDSLILNINGIEKENIVAGGISSIGNPFISLQNDGAIIDNYTFTYK